MRLSIIIIALLGFSFTGSVDNENKTMFAQFIVEEADTKAESMKIDKFMRKQAGVVMSRMDHTSKKYLVLYNADMEYDQSFFETKFEELGFEISCYREGEHGVDKIIDQTGCQ